MSKFDSLHRLQFRLGKYWVTLDWSIEGVTGAGICMLVLFAFWFAVASLWTGNVVVGTVVLIVVSAVAMVVAVGILHEIAKETFGVVKQEDRVTEAIFQEDDPDE